MVDAFSTILNNIAFQCFILKIISRGQAYYNREVIRTPLQRRTEMRNVKWWANNANKALAGHSNGCC